MVPSHSGLPPDIQAIPFKVETVDHHLIAGRHYRHANEQRPVVVVVHGFFNNKDVHLLRKLAVKLSGHYDIVTFDFRGHGKSSGLFGWTTHEPKDLTAVLEYTKARGYRQVGLLSFSLGAAVSLIVASQRKDIDSLIAVSAPFDFWKIDYHFWEPEMLADLKLNVGHKGVGKGVRPGNAFADKIRPVDVVSQVSPTPVFFIHGANDWLIKPRHSEELFKNAAEPKRLTIMPEAGHAEKIYDDQPEKFFELCKEWFDSTLK